ncbi:MAG: S41 family peptidase [Spirochaetales bacterium]|nr:S41 family peptidase [Spirochaetales bacterium]
MAMIQKKERVVWIGITLFLLGFIFFTAITSSLIAQGPTLDDQQALKKFTEIYTYLREYYVDETKIDSNKLIDGALAGMFKSLDDPYSVYLTKDDLRDLEDTSNGSFGGVGLSISKQRIYDKNGELMENTPIEVVSPLEGTPAFKAGVNAGDLIMRIEDKNTTEMTLDQVVKELRGQPGSKVTVTIKRGASLVFDVTLVRASIEIPTVRSEMMDNGIGYIRIVEFTNFTPARIRDVINEYKTKNLKGLVIDLRSNPGGVLSSVISISDYFLEKGAIVSIRSRVPSQNFVYNSNKNNDIVSETMPIAVLVDKGSASASEILAGALQDNHRAVIIGEKSYGKGTVQHVKFVDDSGFKLTVARFFTPDGKKIDKEGVTPDIEIKEEEYTDSERESFEKILKENLIVNFVSQTPNPTEKQVNDFIAKLKKQGIVLRELALKRLIHREMARGQNNPPVYDLSTDTVLQRAVEYIQKGK